MEVMLLKSSACLMVFMVFYKIVLESLSNHRFKRFYLLTIVLLSVGIPFITFIEYIEPQLVSSDFGLSQIELPQASSAQHLPANYLPIILWSIYGLGVAVMSIRFLNNLYQIHIKIKRNPKKRTSHFITVLLQEHVIPHTFFNYVFLNKFKFEKHEIPEAVIRHEEIHVREKHSMDILFVELLQIILWFNPLVYFLKKDIKLNHEFLADKGVLKYGIPISNYQNILLAYSSHASHTPMAHAINYSLIKKRFTIMNTKSSKKSIWLRSILLLPLLAVLIYGFSSTKQIEKGISPKIFSNELDNDSNNPSKTHTARSMNITILGNDNYEIDGVTTTKKNFINIINTLHQDITPEIRNRIMNIHISSLIEVSNYEVWFIYNSLLDYGFHRIVTDNQEIIREKGNHPFAITDTLTSDYSKVNITENDQEGATKKQIKEYNKLASYYNKMIKDGKQIRIQDGDLNRLKYIYDLMSAQQRKNAEPFPKFPPPPPPPAATAPVHVASKVRNAEKSVKGELMEVDAPPPPPIPENASPAQKIKYQKVIDEYNKRVQLQKERHKEREEAQKLREKQLKERKEDVLARREALKEVRNEQMKEREALVLREKELRQTEMAKRAKERQLEIEAQRLKLEKSELDPPPPPKSPLDYTVNMAKRGASFFYEGKPISSDEAIKLLKTRKDIHVSAKGSQSKNPVVHLSSIPVEIKN